MNSADERDRCEVCASALTMYAYRTISAIPIGCTKLEGSDHGVRGSLRRYRQAVARRRPRARRPGIFGPALGLGLIITF